MFDDDRNDDELHTRSMIAGCLFFIRQQTKKAEQTHKADRKCRICGYVVLYGGCSKSKGKQIHAKGADAC